MGELPDDPARARQHFESAAILAQESNAEHTEAIALIGIGKCLLVENEFNQAVPLLCKGLATLRKRGDVDKAAEIGYWSASTLYYAGRFQAALAMISTVRGEAQTAEGKAQMAELTLLRAVILDELDELTGAASSARHAREMYLELEPLRASDALAIRAESNARMVELGLTGTEARAQFEKFAQNAHSARRARQEHSQLKHPQASDALHVWAETLLRLGKSLTSGGNDGNWATYTGRELLRTARKEFQAHKMESRAADMLVAQGRWADQDKQARQWLTDAIAEYAELNEPERIEHARELLAQRSR